MSFSLLKEATTNIAVNIWIFVISAICYWSSLYSLARARSVTMGMSEFFVPSIIIKHGGTSSSTPRGISKSSDTLVEPMER